MMAARGALVNSMHCHRNGLNPRNRVMVMTVTVMTAINDIACWFDLNFTGVIGLPLLGRMACGEAASRRTMTAQRSSRSLV